MPRGCALRQAGAHASRPCFPVPGRTTAPGRLAPPTSKFLSAMIPFKRLLPWILFGSLSAGGLCAAEELRVVADATVDEEFPGMSFGLDGTVVSRDSESNGPRPLLKGYLMFDASGRPPVRSIEAFEFTYTFHRNRSASFFLIEGEAADDWSDDGQNAITYENAPANNTVPGGGVGFPDKTGAEGFAPDNPAQRVIKIGQTTGAGQNQLTRLDLLPGAKAALLRALNTGNRKATLAFQHGGTALFAIASRDNLTNLQPATLRVTHGTAAAAAGDPIRLAPAADAMIDAGNPGQNFGKVDTLIARDANGGEREVLKIYMRFDARGLPRFASLDAFTFSYATGRARSATFYLLEGEGADDWSESALTWNNAPANNPSVNGDFGQEVVADPRLRGQAVREIAAFTGNPHTVMEVPLYTQSQNGIDAAQLLLDALNNGNRQATIIVRHGGTRFFSVASRESADWEPPLLKLSVEQ